MKMKMFNATSEKLREREKKKNAFNFHVQKEVRVFKNKTNICILHSKKNTR